VIPPVSDNFLHVTEILKKGAGHTRVKMNAMSLVKGINLDKHYIHVTCAKHIQY